MPDYNKVLDDVGRLKIKFQPLHDLISKKQLVRFGIDTFEIPEPYRDNAELYHSAAIREEGRQVSAILHAVPQPHVIPPMPEDQSLTTKIEQWLAAGDIELEGAYGNASDACGDEQIHHGLGWVYEAPKRDYYAEAPEDADEREKYKREHGIAAAYERRFVPLNTTMWTGNVRNPLCVYEVKEVDEHEFLKTYGYAKSENRYVKIDGISTTPSGWAEGQGPAEKVTVVEYWDRQWMCIVVRQPRDYNGRGDPELVEEWEHGFGRVPYFACPAFENAILDVEKQFEGPLEGLYAEVPRLNRLVTMKDNSSFMRSYPSWQDVAKEDSSPVLDDNNRPVTSSKYRPGEIFHTLPGHEIKPLPMDAAADLINDINMTELRIKQFSMSDVTRGVSPGADTANSAISQLRRLQRSSLEKMARNRGLMFRDIYKFRLHTLQHVVEETVYVFDHEGNVEVGLSPDEVITTNLHVKYSPDAGSDSLIEEKQAAELTQLGLITELEFHERRGKENPDEFVRSNVLERLWKGTATTPGMEPSMAQEILANLGDVQAITRLIAANQETGSARNGVQGVMTDIEQRLGTGSGRGMMERTAGNDIAAQQTTRPDLSRGY